MSTPEQARSMIRKLYSADADIETDLVNNILLVKIHNTNHFFSQFFTGKSGAKHGLFYHHHVIILLSFLHQHILAIDEFGRIDGDT